MHRPAAGRNYRINRRGAIEARRSRWAAKTQRHRRAQYRYISPVFTYDDDGRIHRFSSFGLVNKPNLLTKALNAEQPTTENIPMLAAAIRAALGAQTATEDRPTAAIKTLKEAKETALNSEKAPSLQLYVPRGDYNALEQRALNAEQQLKQRAEDGQAEKPPSTPRSTRPSRPGRSPRPPRPTTWRPVRRKAAWSASASSSKRRPR
ncbi:phage protease [Ectopseudomonas oleovorans]|uniref:phage protease n=1 Tax=Ectopseudomonas oleovorans TaxID=301 RepID=UPI003F1C4062